MLSLRAKLSLRRFWSRCAARLRWGPAVATARRRAVRPIESQADSRTAAAVELAEHFARDHRSIDEMALARARDHFADAELCELVMFMGFMWAGGTFGAVLGLEPLRSSL
jgi:hypothetical protein